MISLPIAGLLVFALICLALAARAFQKRRSRKPVPTYPREIVHRQGMQLAAEAAIAAQATKTTINQELGACSAGAGAMNRTVAEGSPLLAPVRAIERAMDSMADDDMNADGSDGHCVGGEEGNQAVGSEEIGGRPDICSDAHGPDSIADPAKSTKVPPIALDDVPTPGTARPAPAQPDRIEPHREASLHMPVEPSLGESAAHVEREGPESLRRDAQSSQAIQRPAAEPPSSERAAQPTASGQALTADANAAGAELSKTETENLDPVQTEADADGSQLPVAKPKTPRQFRPSPRAVRQPSTAKADTGAEPAFDRALPICVRLAFEKASYCRISLLARRASNHPAELAISGSGDPRQLMALQDEWFQDFVPSDAGHLLRRGIQWTGSLPNGEVIQWSLSGRELYVLAPHDELHGFVSAPRLVIGEKHVVLCTTERLREVSEAVIHTGSQPPTVLNSGKGIPAGWVALRDVVPRTPVPASAEGSILDALRPLAEVQIALEGGIRLERQAWLAGHPPRIRLRGDIQSAGTVRIDGIEATMGASGSYSVPSWDRPGQHIVSCSSASRGYAIREGAEDWPAWDAYRWSMGDFAADGEPPRPAICGAAVRPPPAARMSSHLLVVPASNTVLIGPIPGDIEICSVRADLHPSVSIAFPPFDPVWAIPADPLRSVKRVARVLLIGKPHYPNAKRAPDDAPRSRHAVREYERRVDAWQNAILTAGRKGLLTEPQSIETAELWRAYRKSARAVWRRR